MLELRELDSVVRLVAPIHGVSSSGGISFRDDATAEQRTAAQVVVADWDFVAGGWRPGSEQERLQAQRDTGQQAAREAAAKEHARRLIDGDFSALSDEGLAIAYAALGQAKAVYGGLSDVSGRVGRTPKTWSEAVAAAKATLE